MTSNVGSASTARPIHSRRPARVAPRDDDLAVRDHDIRIELRRVRRRVRVDRLSDDAERRGDIPGFLVPLVRRVVERAPLDKLIQGGISLSDVLG